MIDKEQTLAERTTQELWKPKNLTSSKKQYAKIIAKHTDPLEAKISKLEARLTDASEANSEMITGYALLEKELSDRASNFVVPEKIIDQCHSELESTRLSFQKQTARANDALEELDKANAKIAELEKEIINLLFEATKRLDTLLERQLMREMINQLQSQVATLREALEGLLGTMGENDLGEYVSGADESARFGESVRAGQNALQSTQSATEKENENG